MFQVFLPHDALRQHPAKRQRVQREEPAPAPTLTDQDSVGGFRGVSCSVVFAELCAPTRSEVKQQEAAPGNSGSGTKKRRGNRTGSAGSRAESGRGTNLCVCVCVCVCVFHLSIGGGGSHLATWCACSTACMCVCVCVRACVSRSSAVLNCASETGPGSDALRNL